MKRRTPTFLLLALSLLMSSTLFAGAELVVTTALTGMAAVQTYKSLVSTRNDFNQNCYGESNTQNKQDVVCKARSHQSLLCSTIRCDAADSKNQTCGTQCQTGTTCTTLQTTMETDLTTLEACQAAAAASMGTAEGACAADETNYNNAVTNYKKCINNCSLCASDDNKSTDQYMNKTCTKTYASTDYNSCIADAKADAKTVQAKCRSFCKSMGLSEVALGLEAGAIAYQLDNLIESLNADNNNNSGGGNNNSGGGNGNNNNNYRTTIDNPTNNNGNDVVPKTSKLSDNSLSSNLDATNNNQLQNGNTSANTNGNQVGQSGQMGSLGISGNGKTGSNAPALGSNAGGAGGFGGTSGSNAREGSQSLANVADSGGTDKLQGIQKTDIAKSKEDLFSLVTQKYREKYEKKELKI